MAGDDRSGHRWQGGLPRRGVLAGSLAAAAALSGHRLAAPVAPAAGTLAFPKGFVWGTSTSAYQIEGAVTADGRGPSIWDNFTHMPGKVKDGETGDVACDHYHRYREDIDLMAAAGLGAYRFSVAWPRILPAGTGAVNPAGLDFYDRLTDALLDRGIAPWVCLYHWDLPQALQDRGGWTNRAIADWFAEYALVVARRLGDRVGQWAMLNEPSVVAVFGHGQGGHAPDLRGRANYAAAIHHQNLAQGQALQTLRTADGGAAWQLGTVLSVQPVRAVGGGAANEAAAQLWDAVWNRACLDPLLLGRYPSLLDQDFGSLVQPGDLEVTRQPIDFLGLNYYSRMHQQADPAGLFGTGWGPPPEGTRFTSAGWPIEPDGLYDQLIELRDRYGNPTVYITENGASFVDPPMLAGERVDDEDRVHFLSDHLVACHRALVDGANLRGYFVWTLLDNFEWALGYTEHFGLVAIDRATLARTPKASYAWYGEVASANALTPA
jgi:beta-glucosidase